MISVRNGVYQIPNARVVFTFGVCSNRRKEVKNGSYQMPASIPRNGSDTNYRHSPQPFPTFFLVSVYCFFIACQQLLPDVIAKCNVEGDRDAIDYGIFACVLEREALPFHHALPTAPFFLSGPVASPSLSIVFPFVRNLGGQISMISCVIGRHSPARCRLLLLMSSTAPIRHLLVSAWQLGPDSGLPFRFVLGGLSGHAPFEWLLLPLASPTLLSFCLPTMRDDHAPVPYYTSLMFQPFLLFVVVLILLLFLCFVSFLLVCVVFAVCSMLLFQLLCGLFRSLVNFFGPLLGLFVPSCSALSINQYKSQQLCLLSLIIAPIAQYRAQNGFL